jgi:hypothetical protein
MVEFEKNLSLLKIRNNYTVVEEIHESNEIAIADEEAKDSLEGVTYIRFYNDEPFIDEYGYHHQGGLRVQLRHGDGETPLKDLPSISYSADGIMAGKTEITTEVLERIRELEGISKFSTRTVILAEDLTFTVPFGKFGSTEPVTKADFETYGKYTISAKKAGSENNMTLHDLLLAAFATDTMPQVTPPNLSVTLTNFGDYEVGTEVTLTYKFSTTKGKYEYGPDTGVTWGNYSANLTGNSATDTAFTADPLTKSSGSFTVKVLDGTSLKFTGSAQYSAGAIPNSALKEGGYPGGQIVSDTDTVNPNNTLKGYRKIFMGTLADKTTEITSSVVRTGLANAKSLAAAKGNHSWSTTVAGAYRLVIAVPAGYEVTGVLDKNDSNTNIINSFNDSYTLPICGAAAGTEKDYLVYVLESGKALNPNTYTVVVG